MEYKFDKNLKFDNPNIIEAKENIIKAIEFSNNSGFPLEYAGRILCYISEVDEQMCLEELNKSFPDVLFALLLEISDDLDKAIKGIFEIYNKPYQEQYIQRMLHLAVTDIVCHSMNGNKIESYKQALIDFLA